MFTIGNRVELNHLTDVFGAFSLWAIRGELNRLSSKDEGIIIISILNYKLIVNNKLIVHLVNMCVHLVNMNTVLRVCFIQVSVSRRRTPSRASQTHRYIGTRDACQSKA